MNSAIELSYDDLGRMSKIKGAKTETRYSYLSGANGSKTTIPSYYSVRKESNTNSFYHYSSYSYDDLGNILTVHQIQPTSLDISYEYDNQSQLKSETRTDGKSRSYTYDTFGNLRTAKYYENQVLTESHTYTYGNSSWPDLLTAYDGQNIAYEGHTYNPNTGVVSGVWKNSTGDGSLCWLRDLFYLTFQRNSPFFRENQPPREGSGHPGEMTCFLPIFSFHKAAAESSFLPQQLHHYQRVGLLLPAEQIL